MNIWKVILVGWSFLLAGTMALAADTALLIQVESGGRYRVWHVEGETHMSEEEILSVAANAKPEGGEPVRVAAGTARAFQTEHGVVIEIADAKSDQALLIDRDDCGAIKVWHSEGATHLTDEQLTELVMSALPGGGRRVKVDDRYAKAFVTPLGYAVVIWQAVVR
jgi:hypothetical protein